MLCHIGRWYVKVIHSVRNSIGVGWSQRAMRPCRVLLAAEDEFQFASLHQFLVGYVAAVKRSAIEQNVPYEALLFTSVDADDRQSVAIGQMKHGTIDKGPTKHILIGSRRNRIEPQRREDQPC